MMSFWSKIKAFLNLESGSANTSSAWDSLSPSIGFREHVREQSEMWIALIKRVGTPLEKSCANTSNAPVYQGDTFLFNLMRLAGIRQYNKAMIFIFDTSVGVDFIKIVTDDSEFGIGMEYYLTEMLFPEYEAKMQSLLLLQVGHSKKSLFSSRIEYIETPCDLLEISHKETGETKEIYFDISSFYGKYDF